MLKLTVMIECDHCRETFHRIAVSTDRDPSAWDSLPLLLEATAEAAGWNTYFTHQCTDCAPEIIDDTELEDDALDDTIPF